MKSPTSRAARVRRRPLWQSALKTVIGIGLLAALLIWNNNGSKLLDVFGSFRPRYMITLLLIAIGINIISSTKWGLFLWDRGHQLPWWRLFELYLIGKFFSNFLPSMFGGDFARVYMVGREINSYSVSAASVFLERGTGLVGLTLLVLLVSLLNPMMLMNPILAISIAGITVVTSLGLLAFYYPPLFTLGVRICDRIPVVRKIAHKVERVLSDIAHYRSRHRLLLLSLLYSIAFNIVAALNVYVSCLAIGFEPGLLNILVVTPVILVLAMIPVSPNNIGWWEWCFSMLLATAGATAAEGLAVALIIRVMTFVVSSLGGLLLLRTQLGASATSHRQAKTNQL